MADMMTEPQAGWDAESRATWEVARRYHECWRARDAEAALALFHPEIEYCDFYRNLTLAHADLPAYLAESMPHGGKSLRHTDRIRVDGDTAFIQYRYVIRLASSGKLVGFQGGEAIQVRDGLIVAVREYCTPVRLSGNGPAIELAEPAAAGAAIGGFAGLFRRTAALSGLRAEPGPGGAGHRLHP